MKKFLTVVVSVLCSVLCFVCSKAAVSNGIICDGEGSINKQLATGGNAVVAIADCKVDIKVDGKDLGYPYSTRHVGTAVISEDDLLHMFWLTGHYVVIDLRSGKWLFAGASAYDVTTMKIAYTKASSTTDTSCVLGITGKDIHSCISTNRLFKSGSDSELYFLMSRAEFEALISGATPMPTATATPEATGIPGKLYTPEPTVNPTIEPSAAPATDVPSVTVNPTIEPSAAPATDVPSVTVNPTTEPSAAPATDVPSATETPNASSSAKAKTKKSKKKTYYVIKAVDGRKGQYKLNYVDSKGKMHHLCSFIVNLKKR